MKICHGGLASAVSMRYGGSMEIATGLHCTMTTMSTKPTAPKPDDSAGSARPTKPSRPAKPAKPSRAAKPAKPSRPAKPATPATPTKPTTPMTTEPTTPTKPTTPMTTEPNAPDPAIDARIQELLDQIAARDVQIAQSDATIAALTAPKKRNQRQVLLLNYPGMATFTIPYRNTRESSQNIFNYFHEHRGYIRLAINQYQKDASEENVEFAKYVHKLMIENTPNHKEHTDKVYKYTGDVPDTKTRARWAQCFNNFSSLYLRFCAVFQDHFEPHREYMVEIDRLRQAYNAHVRPGASML